MEEVLLTFGLAILAAWGVAAFLRMRRNNRKASEEIIVLQEKFAALAQRIRDLELERRLSELRVGCAVPAESSPNTESGQRQRVPPAATPKELAFPRIVGREKELARLEDRLYALKSILPQDAYVGEKYLVEFDSILNLLERETGSNLDRFRISAPRERWIFRLNILALLGFCAHYLYQPQLPRGFVPAPPEAADRIH